jgi:RNA polymerase sigma-70 factor, ECF subfamily
VTDDSVQTGTGQQAGLARLAAAARGGDQDSLDRLLAAARPLLLRWARRLADDPAAAEDIAQDALVEVHQTLAALREPGAVTAWLYLITRKHAGRHRRRRRAVPVLDLNLPAPWPEPAVTGELHADPELQAEHAEDRAEIRTALALVADADRLLLVLRYYGGWPESDLAALLGITGGAVRKRLHAARRRLADGLESGYCGAATPAAQPDPWEELMTDVRDLLGSSYDLGDPMPGLPPGLPPLSLPASPVRLDTGIKVLDTLVPLPRGGVVELTGQAGTGGLALLAEILGNLAAVGPAALVAVSSARPVAGVSARLWKLLEPPAPGAAPAAPWPGAEAEVRTAASEMIAGRLPAIDVLASRSALLDSDALPAADIQAAHRACDLLDRATRLRDYLTQPLRVTEPATGIPGQAIPAAEAVAGLAQVLGTASV